MSGQSCIAFSEGVEFWCWHGEIKGGLRDWINSSGQFPLIMTCEPMEAGNTVGGFQGLIRGGKVGFDCVLAEARLHFDEGVMHLLRCDESTFRWVAWSSTQTVSWLPKDAQSLDSAPSLALLRSRTVILPSSKHRGVRRGLSGHGLGEEAKIRMDEYIVDGVVLWWQLRNNSDGGEEANEV